MSDDDLQSDMEEFNTFFKKGIETIGGQRARIRELEQSVADCTACKDDAFEKLALLQKEFDEYRDDAKEHFGPYGPHCMYIGKFDAGECYICYAKRKKREAGEMQLVAGRWQYLFEQAMKMVNKIDDLFEYAYDGIEKDKLREMIHGYMKEFTDEVSKVRRSPTEKKT